MRSIRNLLKKLLVFSLCSGTGVLITLAIVFVVYLNSKPDLSIWHTVDLDAEFTQHSNVHTFEGYLALEDRLFRQLDKQVYAKTRPGGPDSINRYRRGSLADPARWKPNFNRSFLLQADHPKEMVLLLHGLSDSPYSLRQMALSLHRAGATVLALRLPGHGTAPSGLVTVRWQDMAAAVRLAMNHLAKIGHGRPISIVGYSNGAALAVHYTLDTLAAPELPRVARLVLLSPEIGVTQVAALAVWQARLGHLLGLDKLAWYDIELEYDPFKYNSFAINGGDLSYRITGEIQRQLKRLSRTGALERLPPILAFSSVIDATVEAPALVRNLFNRLPAGHNELVLFDRNRLARAQALFKWKPDQMIAALRADPGRHYTLTLVTNASDQSLWVIARQIAPDGRTVSEAPLGLKWPPRVYSLSHVALPIPPDDPLYGGYPSEPSPGIRLGNIALRGERGALAVSDSALLRLRWNPFYSWLEKSTLGFIGLGAPGADAQVSQ